MGTSLSQFFILGNQGIEELINLPELSQLVGHRDIFKPRYSESRARFWSSVQSILKEAYSIVFGVIEFIKQSCNIFCSSCIINLKTFSGRNWLALSSQ